MLRYGSVCSGIEAASMAWEPLGMEPAWFAEIELFPSAVLAHHWPQVDNLGDMTTIAKKIMLDQVEAPDVLVGGTPCQAFSVAGLRQGLEDSRGQLTIKFVELANAIDDARRREEKEEAIVVWENVPGVFSDKSNAFGCFLAALVGEEHELQPAGKKWTNAGVVYGPQRAAAWRVLDAQYFGVPQRRRRVFLVASAREGFDPGAVLFESESLRRDFAPSRKKKQDVAAQTENCTGVCCQPDDSREGVSRWPADVASTLAANYGNKMGLDDQHVNGGCPLFVHRFTHPPEIANILTARMYKGTNSDLSEGQSLVVHGPCVNVEKAFTLGRNNDAENVLFCGTQNDAMRDVDVEISPTLRSGSGGGAVNPVLAIHEQAVRCDGGGKGRNSDGKGNGLGIGNPTDPMFTLTTRDKHSVFNGSAAVGVSQIRRLTPMECERLQGFPDNHTRIPWKNKAPEDCPDGPRYKALGNSKAVPVVRWLGQRLLSYLTWNGGRE